MRRNIRLAVFLLVAAVPLACSPKSSHAGASAGPAPVSTGAKVCYFKSHGLPCPCPKAEQARVLARAGQVTASAMFTAVKATAVALHRVDHSATR